MSGFYFDGVVPGAVGQGNTIIQWVHYLTRGAIAKVGDLKTIQREYDVACAVRNVVIPVTTIGDSYDASEPRILDPSNDMPTVMPVLAMVIIPQGKELSPVTTAAHGSAQAVPVKTETTRAALILPAYTTTLANFHKERGALNKAIMLNIALCMVAAIQAFNRAGFCHADIKPNNIMLSNHSLHVVLIDYGSAVRYGETFFETSDMYPLGCQTASLEYDRCCLAAVLYELKGGNLSSVPTAEQLMGRIKQSGSTSMTDAMVLDLLNFDMSLEELWMAWTTTHCDGVPVHCLVDFKSIW